MQAKKRTRGKNKNPLIGCKERTAWLGHKHGARVRGINFDFTYEEWTKWWETHLGPNWFELRGNATGKYVMARNGDKGPYAPWNVRCITMADNLREAIKGTKRGNCKLTKKQVEDIYIEMTQGRRTKGFVTALADRHNVGTGTIRNIVIKATWRHVTDLLD